ncbi:MAG TPA: hypothetical protein VK543_05490 [Puia sp.]|nr:hypothetical protein [Puia sp.]
MSPQSMLQFALDRLDEIITEELNPLSSAISSLNKEGAVFYIAKVKEETGAIRKFLWGRLQEIQSKEQIRILAMQYQESITYLLGEVQGYRSQSGANQRVLGSLYDDVENHLKQSLAFIQRHFSVWIVNVDATNNTYLHVSLNEPELSAFFCALVDSGIIINQTYTSLFEFVAPILATRHKKGLTAGSMLKSKDKLTADMKQKLKDLLMEMSRQMVNY